MSDQIAAMIREITANPHKTAYHELVSLFVGLGYSKDEAEDNALILLSNTNVYA